MATNPFNEMFGQFTGEDGKEYRCIACKYPMDRITVKTVMGDSRKLFYCKRSQCEKFGLVTVVAKK